jgi:NADPH2 dehydrogenase
MHELVDAYINATRRAHRVGFDLIELHAAHGYLLHSFLSPLSNQRLDQYGGSLENRMRFPLELFDALREVWPADRPLGVRISATDWVEGGWTLEDSLVFAQRLRERDCDYIACSSGGTAREQKITVEPGYQVPFAETIRRKADIATIAVGLVTDPHHAEEIVATGAADLVALGRGIMYNPRWAWHAAEVLGGTATRLSPTAKPVDRICGVIGSTEELKELRPSEIPVKA